MGRKHKNPPGNFCPRVPIMHSIDSYLARSKYHLTIKNLVCKHFYGPPDFGGLAAEYYCVEEYELCGLPQISGGEGVLALARLGK